jgi:Na+-driven multidrug efflux pump
MVISYGGDAALGAFGILQRVSMFATIPAMVFAQALQPVLGYNYGAKRYGLGLKAINTAVIVSTILSIFGFAVLYLVPGPIIRIFTDDQALIDVGIYASRLYFLALPIMGAMMVGQLIFQAIGKAMRAFITAIVRPIVFLVPLVLIMSNLWDLDGVFLSVPASDLLTLLLVIVLVAPVISQLRKLAAVEKQKKTAGVVSPELLPVPESSRTIN